MITKQEVLNIIDANLAVIEHLDKKLPVDDVLNLHFKFEGQCEVLRAVRSSVEDLKGGVEKWSKTVVIVESV